jgi:hypothetical protein
MEAKHTPGPWEVITDVDRFEIDSRTRCVAVTRDNRSDDAANAALIAAAPDMYEALAALVAAFDSRETDPAWQMRPSTVAAWKASAAAIAKAEGR